MKTKETEVSYTTDNQLSEKFQVSRQTIWRWVREGKFPTPVKLGPNCTRWRLEDIAAWESGKESGHE